MVYFSELAGGQYENGRSIIIPADNILPLGRKRVNIFAMGDVGGTVATGLHLLGTGIIERIGIYDINRKKAERFEAEINQIQYPFFYGFPQVEIIDDDNLFDCDVFVFCASKGVPPVGTEVKDVRMIQYRENAKIIVEIAERAGKSGFSGLLAVVSDPVDQLCMAAAATGCIRPEQIKGFGLGVMNARAVYFAGKDRRFETYLSEGRAFGQHGEGLVLANSISAYDDSLSRWLTQLAVNANKSVRESGFKPYIAPAYSSAAISLIQLFIGEWHYSSIPFGDVYFGCKNREYRNSFEAENLKLDEKLYKRLETSYNSLKSYIQ